MKLSCLYSNQPEIFAPIRFSDGLNVVLAHIQHPKDNSKLGHNLGKTLLIEILDFCFLKKVTKDHLFKRHAELFTDFVFFLEIQHHDGSFLTIRRSACEPTKIAFKRHAQAGQNFTDLDEKHWDHWRESFDNAVVLLDSILAFTPIKPWPYRKGLGYFLRGQSDYGHVFQLAKFGVGRHKDWKPYVAKVLGFNDTVLNEKYDADAATAKLQNDASEIQSEVTLKTKDFDKLRASIAVKRNEVEAKVRAIDAFDFHGQEADLAREVAESTEIEISENNNMLYNARHDLAQVERGLTDDLHFNLDDVRRVFEEAKITFPGQLAKDYDDLLEFNRRIHTERRASLMERASSLKVNISKLENDNASLSKRRMEILRVLGGTDSLQKFKDLQRQIDQDRANLTLLETKASKLESLITIQDQVRQTKARVEELTAAIQQMIHQGSHRYTDIQLNFSRIIKEVTQRTALLYVDQNGEGNLDFHAEFNDDVTDLHTEESRGTSFRQLLCIAFDLAILISHAKEPFFHFVYHDGGLERLQNKLKLALLKIIRETCAEHGIQYMFSALSEDIPYLEDTDKVCPTSDEIVLTLNDNGDSGRLFKMPTF